MFSFVVKCARLTDMFLLQGAVSEINMEIVTLRYDKFHCEISFIARLNQIEKCYDLLIALDKMRYSYKMARLLRDPDRALMPIKKY